MAVKSKKKVVDIVFLEISNQTLLMFISEFSKQPQRSLFTLLMVVELGIKGPYADHILIPQGSTEVVYFLISNESPYLCNCKSKISASNSL